MVASLLWVGLAACGAKGQHLEAAPLVVDGHEIAVEIADEPEERTQGLMHRASLQPDHGMLFVYPSEALRSFWMKDTPLPLSIAYISAGGRIVHIADMAPFDTSAVSSQYPAQYALEMEQGWFAAHGVATGDKVDGLPPASAK